MRKFLDIRFYLPSYQRPGRVLWGSPWALVLEVTVYFGRRPRLGGDPPTPPQHSAQREVIIFIYVQGLAGPQLWGMGEVGDNEKRKQEYIVGITWGRRAPPPHTGFGPIR